MKLEELPSGKVRQYLVNDTCLLSPEGEGLFYHLLA